jgi:tetratricopeptide (TPR) repeat protein
MLDSMTVCHKSIHSLFILLALILTASCAHMGYDQESLSDLGLPERTTVPSVPFYPQEAYHCGPAALAMLLSWSHSDFSLQELVSEVYIPERQGTLQPALLSAARQRNRLAYPFRGMDALLQELAAGHPVVVLQNLGLSWVPRWHYAVPIGYDLRKRTITLHSGNIEAREIKWSLFIRTWRRADYWGLVVLPPSGLPASADERSYLKAVLGLEQAGQWEGAARAYAAALQRWPYSLGAIIGLGNSYYSNGDLIGAEQAFRNATETHPQSGEAFNNLAHVLVELDRYSEALEMASHAITLGGPREQIYYQTLCEIQKPKLSER